MKPRGLLMIEHRLIERMIKVIKCRMGVMHERNQIDIVFVDAAVDFIRTYADRTHHGKEEGILFRDLETRSMSEGDGRAMQELVEEHRFARKTVAELVRAKEEGSLKGVMDSLSLLVAFYPEHIRREDEYFFPDTEKYFTRIEQDAMLEEFREFDSKMIHEKYKAVVEGWR